jgi:hypothetical protein
VQDNSDSQIAGAEERLAAASTAMRSEFDLKFEKVLASQEKHNTELQQSIYQVEDGLKAKIRECEKTLRL